MQPQQLGSVQRGPYYHIAGGLATSISLVARVCMTLRATGAAHFLSATLSTRTVLANPLGPGGASRRHVCEPRRNWISLLPRPVVDLENVVCGDLRLLRYGSRSLRAGQWEWSGMGCLEGCRDRCWQVPGVRGEGHQSGISGHLAERMKWTLAFRRATISRHSSSSSSRLLPRATALSEAQRRRDISDPQAQPLAH